MCLEDTVRIPLRARDGSVRAYTIVDATDAEWANQWRWNLNNGYARRTAQVNGRKQNIYLHRELLSLAHGIRTEGDHINLDKLDNRRANLRSGTHAANMQNLPLRKNATSRYRGVSWAPERKKWLANATINGKCVNLGYYVREEDAADAARQARQRHMPFAMD